MDDSKRFSLPHDDEALAVSLRIKIEDLEYDIKRLQMRVVNVGMYKERVAHEKWMYVWNRYLFNRRKNLDHNGGPVQAPQSRRLYINAVDDQLFEKEEIALEHGETWGRAACVDLSSYTYHNDKIPQTSYAAIPPTTGLSASLSETTDPSLSSEFKERLMSGANGISSSTSRSPTSRKNSHVKDENDAASLHRKKDSGHAEGMGGAIAKGSGHADDAAAHETSRSATSRFMDGVSNVMNRGRPNKESRRVRKSSGRSIR